MATRLQLRLVSLELLEGLLPLSGERLLERRGLRCNRRGGLFATTLLASSGDLRRGVLQEALYLALIVVLQRLQTPLGVFVARVQVVDDFCELCNLLAQLAVQLGRQ